MLLVEGTFRLTRKGKHATIIPKFVHILVEPIPQYKTQLYLILTQAIF
jgi:hypothetical protein